jgi:hypothetical protein
VHTCVSWLFKKVWNLLTANPGSTSYTFLYHPNLSHRLNTWQFNTQVWNNELWRWVCSFTVDKKLLVCESGSWGQFFKGAWQKLFFKLHPYTPAGFDVTTQAESRPLDHSSGRWAETLSLGGIFLGTFIRKAYFFLEHRLKNQFKNCPLKPILRPLGFLLCFSVFTALAL